MTTSRGTLLSRDSASAAASVGAAFRTMKPVSATRHRLLLLVALSAIAMSLTGCGGSPDPSDTTVPLDGRQVGRASQLLGTWMRVSAGDVVGFEFLQDDKVLVTGPNGTTTLEYSVLDGGRLSLAGTGGRTTLFGATLAGEVLELAPEIALGREATPQRFQRVKSGQTLAAALQEHAAAMAQARELRYAELEKLLAADDLVLVKAEDQGPTAVLSLQIERRGAQFGGTAVMMDDPARSDVLSPVRVHPLAGRIEPHDEFTDRIRITIDVQPAIAPPGQEGIRGALVLIADGPVNRPVPTGMAEFPNTWLGQAGFALKRDARAHALPMAKLEEQAEAARRAIAKVADPLGGRAVMTGQKTSSRGGAPESVAVTLERVADSNNFTAQVKIGAAPEQSATGNAELLLGEGAVYLSLSNGEQWRLQLTDTGTDYGGLWRPNTRSDFLGHGNVELQLSRTWTVAQVQAEREAMQRFIASDLRTPIQFTGFVDVGRPGDPERWAVWAELQTKEDGSAVGRAWLLGQSLGVELAGSVAGESITLSSTGPMDGSVASRSLTQQRWQLSLSSMDPTPRLTGRMNATLGGGGTVELAPVDPTATAGLTRELVAALRDSAFQVVNTSISRNPEPSYFRFQVDPASGRITGDAIGTDLTGRRPSALPPGLISGEVVEERGHSLLRLVVDGSPEPVRGRPGERFEFTLAASRSDEHGLRLFGWGPVGQGNQTWLTLTPAAAGTEIVVTEEQRLRLAAQKLGALAAPPTDPTIGDTVVVIVNVTERDQRVGQLFYADGKYTHRNSVATAAIHAGVAVPGEVCVVELTYGPPFTAPVTAVEQNGVTSQRGTFRENNPLPTYTIRRLQVD